MIRVSIELPERYNYRFKPLVDSQAELLSHDVLIDYKLPTPDLRILHQDLAIEELNNSEDGRLRTPTIVYERVDAAVVINDQRVRGLMQHQDVKLWLKRNTFRDYRKNNENLLIGQHHYMSLNETQKFNAGSTLGEAPTLQITEEMARKIRSLPIAGIDRFERLRSARIDWSAKRPIDIAFAGTVDYEVQGNDYWDTEFDRAQSSSITGFGEIINKHRREAARQMIEMKHLRILVGMNRAVDGDLYEQIMLRSSISVSPWGLGEYGYRDYEAILAGSVLVKPYSDHIMTFSPDIYQANKYYVPCAMDFSDLHEVVRRIMSDRDRAIEIAKAAREDLLAANRKDRIAKYFLRLFGEALDISDLHDRRPLPSVSTARSPLIGIAITPPTITRATLETRPTPVSEYTDKLFVLSDTTERNSHDIRLVRRDVWETGVYRVRCILRRVGRRHLGIQVHHVWESGISFGVDLDTGEVAQHDPSGSGFSLVQKPRVMFGQDQWVAVSAFVRIDRVINGEIFLVMYAAESSHQFYYSGTEEPCFEVAALDLDIVEEFSE